MQYFQIWPKNGLQPLHDNDIWYFGNEKATKSKLQSQGGPSCCDLRYLGGNNNPDEFMEDKRVIKLVTKDAPPLVVPVK